MEKEINVSGKTYNVKELKYKDIISIGKVEQGEAAKQLMILSTGMSEEEYDELSMKVGLEIQKVVNDLNGLTEDFQNPPSE